MVRKNDLFADNIECKEVVLNKPDNETFRNFYDNIDKSFVSADLISICSNIISSCFYNVVVYEYDKEIGEKKVSCIVNKLKKGKSISKSDRVSFLAMLIGDVHNREFYYGSLSQNIKNVLKAVYERFFITVTEVSSLLGYKAVVESGYYTSRKTLLPELYMFKCFRGKKGEENSCYGYSYDNYVFISPFFYDLFYDFVNEDLLYSDRCFKSLPEGEKLRVFHAEKTFIDEFTILQSMFNQKLFKIGDSKKMLLTTVKKISKQVGIKEFFPETNIKELVYSRAVLLLNFFSNYMEGVKKSKTNKAPELTVKDLIEHIDDSIHLQIACFLNHLTGIKYQSFSDYNIYSLNSFLLSYLKNHKDNLWHNVDSIISFINSISKGEAVVFLKGYTFENMKIVNKRFDRVLGYGELVNDVGKPFVRAFFAMLSSLGLVDIAYREFDDKDRSWFDWVKYIRITNLGRYVFGHVDFFDSEGSDGKKTYFELDTKRLIARSLEKKNPFIPFMLDISDPIGGDRYKLSNISFMRNCKTTSELNEKINMFKNFISDDLNDLWNDFFDSMNRKCHAFDKVSSDQYLIYKMDPDNKEIINAMLSDGVISSIVIRAEGYMVLIPKEKKTKVINRFKELGYMIKL